MEFEEAHSLIILADKYNAKGLVHICCDTIIEILLYDISKIVRSESDSDIDLIVESAILGHRLNKKQLVDAAMKKMTDIGLRYKELKNWEKLKEFPDLMADMLEYCSKKVPNYVDFD